MNHDSNKPKGIILHCAATYSYMDIGFKEIDQWHKDRGWLGCGYHKIVRIDATLESGRLVVPFQEGAHCYGKNDYIGIVWVGGKTEADKITPEQEKALMKVCADYIRQFRFTASNIHGHNEFADKECPRINMEFFKFELFKGIREGLY